MSATQWYDNVLELKQRIRTLDDLRIACEARREHWLECRIEVVFLGRIHSGTRGNMLHLLNKVLPDDVDVPTVMLWGDFLTVLDAHGIPFDVCWNHYQSLSTEPYQVPPPHIRCPVCSAGWTLENCTDAYVRQDYPVLRFDEYAGKTLGEVQDILRRERPEAVYHLPWSQDGETQIRHPGGTFIPPDQYDGRTLEQHEEERTHWEKVNASYVVRHGDLIVPFGYQFLHADCMREVLTHEGVERLQEYQQGLIEMLQGAGFTNVTIDTTLPPPHIVEMLRPEYEDEDKDGGEDGEKSDVTAEQIAAELPYLRATTNLGTIGIQLGAEGLAFLDLITTGVTPEDLNFPEWEQAPPELEVCGLDPEGMVLRELYRVLAGRKTT